MSKVILTGFPKLDRMIGSLDRARIIIVAGRPAVGKTAFAVWLARNIAIDQRIPLFLNARGTGQRDTLLMSDVRRKIKLMEG